MEDEAIGPSEEQLAKSYPKDCRDFKKDLELFQDHDGVNVIAIAIAKELDRNKSINIPAFTGDPICNDVHDLVRDCYYVFGVDFYEIGSIPVNYRLSLKGVFGFEVEVPLPVLVIRRYMTIQQKRRFDAWKSQYPEETHTIKYLQVVNVF